LPGDPRAIGGVPPAGTCTLANGHGCVQDQDMEAVQIKPTPQTLQPKILILVVSHGASHRRTAKALQTAFSAIAPAAPAEVVDALNLCTRWFRAYYNSYLILLKHRPSLWGWIEGIQHKSQATGPGWLYRWGARPFFRFLRDAKPDIVIATEVGMCELAVLLKHDYGERFFLAASCGMDADRAWVRPEVDAFVVPPGDHAGQIVAAGAPASKVHVTGMPVDPAFATLPDCQSARQKLGLLPDLPVLLTLFGGAGFGNPLKILPQIRKIRHPVQAVFITGRNPRLKQELKRHCQGRPHSKVLGWVNNIHEWMAAADLLISKPGASTVNEAISAGLPMVAFDPLPGNEVRLAECIEKWQVGRWARHTGEISPIVNHLLSNAEDRRRLRENALAMALPQSAYDAAEAILGSWQAQNMLAPLCD